MILTQLFGTFVMVSLLAFGGGQAALPLLERITVQEMGWATPAVFAMALAFSYATPGPVLIIATFIGYHVAGVPGAFAATFGAFLAPTMMAAGTAAGIDRLADNRWLQAFGRGAAPAVVGLLGATTWGMVQHSAVSVPLAAIAIASCVLGIFSSASPVWWLALGAGLGYAAIRLGV